ncbi:MAG: ABC transporter permease, partial [Pseudomonadales bacterium]|nr:ABC transporter permease [Pseudomonadales bacterium]
MKKLFTSREALLCLLILAMLLSVGSVAKDFLSLSNLLSAYNDTSILIILALGQMLVIITRCIDLSVAANLALTGMVVAMLNSSYPDFPVPLLMLFGMLLGLTMGMINGLLVWKLEIPAIVVTLGTMSIYRGIIFLLSEGSWVNAHEMSEAFMSI